MKSILQIIVLIGLGYGLQLFLPFWGLAIAAGIAALLLGQKTLPSLLIGLIGGAILWGLQAYLIDTANESLLSIKIGQLLGGAPPMAILAATALTGGVIALLGSWTGYSLKRVFVPIKKKRKY